VVVVLDDPELTDDPDEPDEVVLPEPAACLGLLVVEPTGLLIVALLRT
jgi:hypothetical protein